MRSNLAIGLTCVLLTGTPPTVSSARTIEFDTSRVTQPDVAVSPDGRSIVFTMLGHLYQLPGGGGTAKQLTFGMSYNGNPAFSPDGQRLAFISDRDGSAGNVFVLDLPSGEIAQITREINASSPVWSPDGKRIAYLRMLAREEHPPGLAPGFGGTGLGELRMVAPSGGAPTVVAPPKLIQSIFYLSDGRLAWTVISYGGGRGFFRQVTETKVEALSAAGGVSVLNTVEGSLGDVVASPKANELFHRTGGSLHLLPVGGGEAKPVAPMAADGRFAISTDGAFAFFSENGEFSSIRIADGSRKRIPFSAHVKRDVRAAASPRWELGGGNGRAGLRTVMSPRLSPDGKRLVFTAAGDLWQQPLDGGPARQLIENDATEFDPAFSPDGRQLAFVRNEHGMRELCVYDFDSRTVRTIVSAGDSSWVLHPQWSHDAEQLVFQQGTAIFSPFSLIAAGMDGTTEQLAEAAGGWTPRPHLAANGEALYFTSRIDNVGTLYRLPLEGAATPHPVTRLARHVHDALVSPDGKWIAFRRNSEIWAARLGNEPIDEEDVHRISTEGGRSFSFTPDGKSVLYAAGSRVWRQPLEGGERSEIPLQITIRPPARMPLLLRRVRVLDFTARGFGSETSMLITDGRIQWIGSETNRDVPGGAVVLDGAGRYAIPGIFDLHVHCAWSNQQANHDAFIAYGITSVRDTGGRLDYLNLLADRGAFTAAPVPRFFYSGEIFEGASPLWGDAFLQIYDQQDARAHVRRWKERGAHFIKVYPSLPWHLQRVVAGEAHRQGLPIVGHGLSTPEIVKSVILGYAVLEHAARAQQADVLQLLVASGTQWDPTLSISGSGMVTTEEPQRLDDEKFRTFVPGGLIQRGGGMFGRMPIERRRAMWKSQLAEIRTAHEQGIRLRAGTDALMGGIYFGPSLHWELEHFVEAGLTPLDVLQMATAGAAATVGAAEHLGTLAPGKLADIVLLDGDPLENIRHTQSIWRVVKAGRLYDPKSLRPSASD